jgi:hypothetical protein
VSATQSELSDEDIRYFTDFCQCVGFVVLNWSLIEQQLDNWVNVCFHNCGGKPFAKGRGVPVLLKAKSRFLRTCFRSLPLLEEFGDAAIALVERIGTASKRRHDLIHGAITELRPDSVTGAFRFRRIGYDGDIHTLTEYVVAPDDFQSFAPILTDLVTDAITLSQRLGDRFPAQQGQPQPPHR